MAEKLRIPLPASVSGVRTKINGEEYVVILGSDGCGYAYVSCGRNAHLGALADAKLMVEGLNKNG